jgi:hypothetical protein
MIDVTVLYRLIVYFARGIPPNLGERRDRLLIWITGPPFLYRGCPNRRAQARPQDVHKYTKGKVGRGLTRGDPPSAFWYTPMRFLTPSAEWYRLRLCLEGGVSLKRAFANPSIIAWLIKENKYIYMVYEYLYRRNVYGITMGKVM